MSDYGDSGDPGGYGVDDYGSPPVTVPAGTPITPQVIPRTAIPDMEIPVMPIRVATPGVHTKARTGPVTSPLHLQGLGEFTVSGACSIRALSRVAFRFFTEVAEGRTQPSLATLEVYRRLYNARRGGFANGFSGAAQALLPTNLPAAEWNDALRQTVAIVLAGGLGNGHPAIETLSSMPPAISGLTAWFIALQRNLSPGNLAFLREYLEVPMPTGANPITVLSAYVNDDLRRCTPSSTPTPPPPSSPPVVARNPTSSSPATGGGASAGGAPGTMPSGVPVSSGTHSLLLFGLVGLVGWGLLKAVTDKPGGRAAKPSRLGEFSNPDLAEKARKAAIADAPRMKCVASREYRSTVSMDETAGPKGLGLSKSLLKIPPTAAAAIEELYFEELGKLKPGKICDWVMR